MLTPSSSFIQVAIWSGKRARNVINSADLSPSSEITVHGSTTLSWTGHSVGLKVTEIKCKGNAGGKCEAKTYTQREGEVHRTRMGEIQGNR